MQNLQHRIYRLRTEPFRRWSNGFTCFFFVLIGAPVAMMRRNGDVMATFFVCFLPILVAYYPLLLLSENLSTTGKMPPCSFWLGNIAMVALAFSCSGRWCVTDSPRKNRHKAGLQLREPALRNAESPANRAVLVGLAACIQVLCGVSLLLKVAVYRTDIDCSATDWHDRQSYWRCARTVSRKPFRLRRHANAGHAYCGPSNTPSAHGASCC